MLSILESEGLLGEEVVAPDDETWQLELVQESLMGRAGAFDGAFRRSYRATAQVDLG